MRRGVRGIGRLVGVAVVALITRGLRGEAPAPEGERMSEARAVRHGDVLFEFDPEALRALGFEISIRGANEEPAGGNYLRSVVQPSSRVERDRNAAQGVQPLRGRVDTFGALMVVADGRRDVIGNLSLRNAADGSWTVFDTLGGGSSPRVVMELGSIAVDAPQWADAVRLAGELLVAREWADRLGVPNAAGQTIGRVVVSIGEFQPVAANVAGDEDTSAAPPAGWAQTAGTTGPDVIVGNLYQVANWGSSGGISAFSVGTVSCNIGDVWLNWSSSNNQHPVIATNLFRLRNNRFEQIGQSWLKHGFFALSETLCGSCPPFSPNDGSHLGVQCSDPYSASLNGTQGSLGPKSQVDPNLGAFPYPPSSPPFSGVIARRLQVKNSDLDPTLDGGGTYFLESQYVTPDDAAMGHQNNNASYRRAFVSGAFSSWSLSLTDPVQREQSGIRAWKDIDPSVVETDIQIPNEGLFILGAKVTDLGTGYWHYEYAVQNLNSHRAARAFSVPVDPTSKILNVGFHDVDYHSGELFQSTDWTPIVSNGYMTWTTVDYATNPDANALRWGTLYNFRFDVNRPPQSTNTILTLYRAGNPNSVSAASIGPVINTNDCNGNTIPDSQDIANGTSRDCDGNLIPDECQTEELHATAVATGLDRPVYVTAPPGDMNRLFIVEQPGVIKILTGGAVLPTPFLNVSGQTTTDGERGMLSMAFHPDYATNGYFYVDYTDLAGSITISRFTVSGDPNMANGATEVILKVIAHPGAANHNGGQLQFGPDGMLYVSVGDGGGAFDSSNHAQDSSSLLGKMLRLDVGSPPEYIPLDNPFTGPGLPLDEIWALGVRNPWRFSFDRETGEFYIADVGQETREEIDFEPAAYFGGRNYGWRCMEGTSCTGLSGCTCDSPLLTPPILEYGHVNGDCSITGGYVYRGCDLPNFQGTYFYADFCSGAIHSFHYVGGSVTNHVERTTELTPTTGAIGPISSFGEDGSGELYIVGYAGSVYKIVPASTAGSVCGNDIIEPGEQCDDGNTGAGDGCGPTCQAENTPANDACVNAQAAVDGSYAFSTVEATTDGPDESANCPDGNPPLSPDIWYCYTPHCTGTATASLCGSSFDTMLAVYGGCTCPTSPSALDCQDDNCGGSSQISFSVSACESYLVRVGGYNGLVGVGTLSLSCVPNSVVNDCDGNTIEDADDLACGTLLDNDHNGIPDVCEISGDSIVGGRLYDRWWSVTGDSAPTTDHPLWAFRPDPVSNGSTGAATWRCTECHGWDYKGVDGENASGPHRTGIPGIYGTAMTAFDLATLLREPPDNGGGPGVPNGHDYGSVLSSDHIDNLVAFVLGKVIDTDDYVNPVTHHFLGDPIAGQTHYNGGGTINQCVACHGANGAAINFGTPEEPEYLGTVAVFEPLHFLHRGRLGFPGTPMPGWLANGGTNQGAADIGRYAQLSLAVDCIDSAQCDDGVDCTINTCNGAGRCLYIEDNSLCPDDGLFCNGPQICDAALGCVGAGNPCWDAGSCDEDFDHCGCTTPLVIAAGQRYLAVTPQPSASNTAMRLIVTPNCPSGVSKYVGAPSGEFNVATLVADAEQAPRFTIAQWGQTVYVSGLDIVPEVEYLVRAECGVPGAPVETPQASATTGVWGDVAGDGFGPDGEVDALDIVGLVDAFKHADGAPSLFVADIFSCSPNQIIDAIDIVGCLDAYKHISYLMTSCPNPCR